MYDNLADEEILQCGKELNRDWDMNALSMNNLLPTVATTQLNNGDELCKVIDNQSYWTLVERHDHTKPSQHPSQQQYLAHSSNDNIPGEIEPQISSRTPRKKNINRNKATLNTNLITKA